MSKYTHFDAANTIIKNVKSVFLINENNHIKYTIKTPLFKSNLNIFELPSGKFDGYIKSCLHHDSTSGFIYLTSQPYISSQLLFKPIPSFDLRGIVSTPPTKETNFPAESVENHTQNTMIGMISNYRFDSFKFSASFGLSHDHSLSLFTILQHPIASGSIRANITDRSNLLEFSTITVFGPFGYIKGDISLIKLHELELGWMRDWHSGAAFLSFELFNRIVRGKIQSKIGKTVSIASKGRFKAPDDIKAQIGVKVKRDAKFKANLSLDGKIRMMACFSPRKWCKVTLKSETSALKKFQPVNFGWSLDFLTEVEKQPN